MIERLLRRENHIEKLNQKQAQCINEFQKIQNITHERHKEKLIFENIKLQLNNEIQVFSDKYNDITIKAESYLKVL